MLTSHCSICGDHLTESCCDLHPNAMVDCVRSDPLDTYILHHNRIIYAGGTLAECEAQETVLRAEWQSSHPDVDWQPLQRTRATSELAYCEDGQVRWTEGDDGIAHLA